VIAWSPQTFDLSEGGEVNNINGIYASGDYFTVLGVRPAAGRLLAPSDDVHNCSGVAVLSYGFWQDHYAGAQSAIDSSIRFAFWTQTGCKCHSRSWQKAIVEQIICFEK
jgi:MacB-like periplasmic core domain